MRTSAQALRDAIASGAVEAWNRGEKIQCKEEMGIAWGMWDGKEHQTPSFSQPGFLWRPAPTKRRIPFTRDTVPKWALWRVAVGVGPFFTVNVYGADGLILHSDHTVTWKNLAESFEYSMDSGTTWHPGSMEVES